MDTKTIKNNFEHHPLAGEQVASYEVICSQAKGLAIDIQSQCPDSREKSLAFTKLEECIMWANAAIARNEIEGGEQ